MSFSRHLLRCRNVLVWTEQHAGSRERTWPLEYRLLTV